MRWLRRALQTARGREWAIEIAGVGALAVGAWLIFPPAAFIVVGVYAIIAANGGD